MARPTPLPIGRPDPHILQSNGPQTNVMNFYITNYSTSFVKPRVDFNKSKFNDIPAYSGGFTFKPRSAPEHKGTGFTSNVRPQIFYKESMDKLDNPIMRRICADNYTTMTQTQFRPFDQNDGTEDLPAQVQGLDNSAFRNYTKVHNPLPAEVNDLYIDTKYRSPAFITPKHVPLLHQLNNKDPIPRETFNHGVKYMSTENGVRFEKPENAKIDKHALVGPKQSSGFVTNQENDTLTGIPGERWMYNTRYTGTTNYHDKFLPYDYPRGDEILPNFPVSHPANNTGHAKSILPPTAVNPRSLLFGNPTEFKSQYKGVQRPSPTTAENLRSAVVGPKEESGHTLLDHGFIQQFDDPRRFLTNYQTKHFDMAPKGKDREGYIYGGVNGDHVNGFTKNNFAPDAGSFNPKSNLEHMQSYQSRSIRARDGFYDDPIHINKFNSKGTAQTLQDNNPYSVKVGCT